MARDETTFEIMRAHLSQFPGAAPTCAVCGLKSWAYTKVIAPPRLERLAPDWPLTESDGVFPMVALTCRGCFHVLLFAWRPIEKASDV